MAPNNHDEELLIPFYDENDVEYHYDQEEYPDITPTVLDFKFPEYCNNYQSAKIITKAENLVSSIDSDNTTIIFNEKSREKIPEFCLDHGFNQSRYIGTVAISCELPNEIFCNEDSNTCIKFCCPKGHYVNPYLEICQEYQYDEDAIWWKPDVLNITGSNGRSIYSSYPDCNQMFNMNNVNETIKFLSNGSIRLGGSLEGSVYNWNSYCMSHVESFNENSELIYYEDFQICTGSSITRNELVEWEELLNTKVIPTLQLVSIVSLAILFIFLYQTKNHCLFG